MKNHLRSIFMPILRMAFVMFVSLSLNIETTASSDYADNTPGINSAASSSHHQPEDLRLESESLEEKESDLQKKSEFSEQAIVLTDLLVVHLNYVPSNIDDILLCLPITRVSTSVRSQAPPLA